MDRSERMNVLQLLEQGEISAAEAAARLGGESPEQARDVVTPPPAYGDVPDVPDVPEVPDVGDLPGMATPMPSATFAVDPALGDVPAQEPMPDPAATAATSGPRWLRIRVTDTRSGRSRVNVNVPIALVEFGLRMGKAVTPEVAGVDLDDLSEALKSGSNGKLVEVMDDEDGQLVEILID